MKTVGLLLFTGVQSLDVAGPLDVFAEANGFLAPGTGYRIVTIGVDALPLRASNGQWLGADHELATAPCDFDVLLVPGGPQLAMAAVDERLCAWLRSVCPTLPRFGSICTGAFLLGRAGLLDGKQVTTHWGDAAQLAMQFPQAQVEHDRIHVRDGALLTSAGVTAGIDLALSLVAEDHGPAVALAVAKRLLVVAQRQGGQSQFSPYLQAPADPQSPIARVQAHVMTHIAEPLSVERLADVVAMSPRNFARVFVREAGITPAEFVQRARIDAARHLLEGSQLALKAVAYRCGFGSAGRMRQLFVQRLGVTPSQYRERFQRHA